MLSGCGSLSAPDNPAGGDWIVVTVIGDSGKSDAVAEIDGHVSGKDLEPGYARVALSLRFLLLVGAEPPPLQQPPDVAVVIPEHEIEGHFALEHFQCLWCCGHGTQQQKEHQGY